MSVCLRLRPKACFVHQVDENEMEIPKGTRAERPHVVCRPAVMLGHVFNTQVSLIICNESPTADTMFGCCYSGVVTVFLTVIQHTNRKSPDSRVLKWQRPQSLLNLFIHHQHSHSHMSQHSLS